MQNTGTDSGTGTDGGGAGAAGRAGTSGNGASGNGGAGGGQDAAVPDAGDAGPDDDAGNLACTGDGDCDDQDECTSDSCTNGACTHAAIDPDDGDACSVDACDPEQGVSNVAIDTDDDDACTVDSCDPETGVSHEPVDTDDDDACTVDSCDPATGDIAHDAVDIDDEDACTTDSCDASTGVAHVAVVIDDENACTVDACDAETGISHTPVNVDDSDGCTTDACAAPGGAITHTFCTSGLCDIAETCLDLTVTSFTDNSPLAIPTGPAVVTKTIEVSGAGTVLRDLNVTTFLAHTFGNDLDITLQSPAGTVVTLTTDNGGGNDNTFNGTVWDDSANPGGALPYGTNDGLVTDNVYVNLTPALRLTPEEPLGAFIGENPNGTWTLTISDDLAGDGGSLDQLKLDITTISSAPTVTTQSFAQNAVTALADNAVTTATVAVPADPAGSKLCTLTVATNIIHPFASDLDITLTSPAGTIVTLTTDNAGGNADVFAGTLWDDDANPAGQTPYVTNNGLTTDNAYVTITAATPLAPEEPLSAFIGEPVEGTWTLTVSDDTAGNAGALNSWSLNVGRCFR